jgi:hypothetical protein
MKLAIMQPYFLPYIGYFQLMAAADKFVIYDDVNFIKGGWINRNRILLHGREHLVTIPLTNASPNRLINVIEIVGGSAWRRKLSATIEQAYRAAPYFEMIVPLLKQIIHHPVRNLSAYGRHAIEIIRGYLEIGGTLVPSAAIYNNSKLKGEERVIDICHREKANVYLNAPGGRALYHPERFRTAGISLRFVEPAPIAYPQFGGEFCPSLSIIDVLMFNSREEAKALLSRFELKA